MSDLLGDRLPLLLPLLSALARTLAQECSEETGRPLRTQIEQWENDLSQHLLSHSPSPMSPPQLLDTFRQAPLPILLNALIAQQEALRTLSEREFHAELGGMFTEEAEFWNAEGEGFMALQMGKAALASTWWPFHRSLAEWASAHSPALQQSFEQAAAVLSPGRLAQLAASVASSLREEASLSWQDASLSIGRDADADRTSGWEGLKGRASERFDAWIRTRTFDQRKNHQSIHAQMLAIAQKLVPDPAEEEHDDEVVRQILRYALEMTSLVINQPGDIEAHIADYWSHAGHLRPIALIVSNLVKSVLQSLREHWRQHDLNPYQERLA